MIGGIVPLRIIVSPHMKKLQKRVSAIARGLKLQQVQMPVALNGVIASCWAVQGFWDRPLPLHTVIQTANEMAPQPAEEATNTQAWTVQILYPLSNDSMTLALQAASSFPSVNLW